MLATAAAMMASQFVRRVLYCKYDCREVRPLVDLLHHAEASFVTQAQVVLYAVSNGEVAWKVFLVTSLLYHQTESPCRPAESNPVVGVVKASVRRFDWSRGEASDPGECRRQKVVTQRLVTWLVLFFGLSCLYAMLFHGFFLEFLREEIDPDALEMRLCCRLNGDHYWLLFLVESLATYATMRLNCRSCACSSFLAECFVRALVMSLADFVGLPVYYIFINPASALLPFFVCDYTNSFAVHFASSLLATVVCSKVMETKVIQEEKSEVKDERSGNNSAQANPRRSHEGLLCCLLSMPDEFSDDDQPGGGESFLESYSFAAGVRFKRWLVKNIKSWLTNRRNRNASPNANSSNEGSPFREEEEEDEIVSSLESTETSSISLPEVDSGEDVEEEEIRDTSPSMFNFRVPRRLEVKRFRRNEVNDRIGMHRDENVPVVKTRVNLRRRSKVGLKR